MNQSKKMANQLPVSFTISPVSATYKGKVNNLIEHIQNTLRISTGEQYVIITSGSVAPSSDIGPWMKDGNKLYVWNSGSGSYVPATVEALAGFNTYPFRANASADIDLDFAAAGSASADLVLTEEYDPDNVLSGATFIAPTNGIYHIDAKVGVAVTAGTPTGNTVIFYLKKNSFQMPKETVFSPSQDVIGHTLVISTNVQLNAGDQIKAAVSASVTGGGFPATWTISQNDTWMSGFRVKAL